MPTKADRIKELELILVDMIDEAREASRTSDADGNAIFDRDLIRRAETALGLATKVKVRANMMGGWIALMPEDKWTLDDIIESFNISANPRAKNPVPIDKILKWCEENNYECVNIYKGRIWLGGTREDWDRQIEKEGKSK